MLGARRSFGSLLRARATLPSSSSTRVLFSSHPVGGESTVYAEEMYRAWSADPTSVHASWDAYFRTGSYQAPPTLGVGNISVSDRAAQPSSGDTAKLIHFIRAYQDRGHEYADLDPLGLRREAVQLLGETSKIVPEDYGFTEADLERGMDLSGMESANIEGVMAHADLNSDGQTTLSELKSFLDDTYCNHIGYEYAHVTNIEMSNWLKAKIEIPAIEKAFSKEKKLKLLERLEFATQFEETLATKFNTAKRFGVEGLETLIPGMKIMLDHGSSLGASNFVFGMAHRGRLNVLCNVIRKPMEHIFCEFNAKDFTAEDEYSGSGDVKYHLGTTFEREYPDGRKLYLSLLANPSHLEAVNPIVMGKARAKMHYSKDPNGDTVVPVLLHGDAAFAGQGVVYESMQMTRLEGYSTGGTVHIVTNNQVGFTADPWQSRSTPYASDLGKAFSAPIFHVNADDPEDVARVFELAIEYRQTFHTDVVIDLIGYRRFGHNEIDEPSFTQPLMYKQVKKHPKSLAMYQQKLLAEGIVTQDELSAVTASVQVFSTTLGRPQRRTSRRRTSGSTRPGRASRHQRILPLRRDWSRHGYAQGYRRKAYRNSRDV